MSVWGSIGKWDNEQDKTQEHYDAIKENKKSLCLCAFALDFLFCFLASSHTRSPAHTDFRR